MQLILLIHSETSRHILNATLFHGILCVLPNNPVF